MGAETLCQIYMKEWLGDEKQEPQEAQNRRKDRIASDANFKMRGDGCGQRGPESAESLAEMGQMMEKMS